jgi:SAM-dependent methyltransferase
MGDVSTNGRARTIGLDAGCGTGSMAGVLPGRTFGVDAFPPALRFVRGETVAGGNLLALPFASGTFDVVGCFDVLYHRRVEDLRQALAELHRVCRPNGLVVITDSAGPRLMGPHDVAYHGARRFRLADLRIALEAAGFQVLHGSYFHTTLFPIAAPMRLFARFRRGVSGHNAESGSRRAGRSDLAEVPPGPINRALLFVGQCEAYLASRVRLPFGLSVLVAAQRKGDRGHL